MLILVTGNESGFTLIEVIISIILVGIMLGLILPSFGGFVDSIEEKTIQRKILKLFNQARVEAITTSSVTSVLIKGNDLCYRSSNGEVLNLSQGIKEIELMEDKKDQIYFFPDSRSSGGRVKIKLSDQKYLTLKIDPSTGKTELGEADE